MFKKVLVSLVLWMMAFVSYGDAELNNVQVTQIFSGFDANEGVFFNLESAVQEQGCPNNQVFLSKSHITFTETYSMLLAAAMSNKPVGVGTSGCTSNGLPQVRYIKIDL